METAQITSFLESFRDGITEGNKKLYKKVIESSEIKGFDNYEEFYFAVIYPFEQMLDGFVRSEISDNGDAVFLMTNSQFVESHFEGIVKNKEGFSCCADKSRTIMKMLIKFYSTGEKIEFDYDAEYTFHLPKTVFKTHDQIIDFYKGVKDLFYGSSQKYLKSLKATLEI